MAQVELQSVRKSFGSQVIIPGMDFTIQSGEFVALVGPSGCGKSTILRMIAGLEDATSGTIRIGGRAVNDVSPKDRGVAMVFQNYALYPHMSVRENLGFALKMSRVERSEMDRRIQATAEVLELGPLLDRKPAQLSGGQKQRVAMGRAMIRNPQVLLFDEPLSNLDAQLRVKMRSEIALLHQRLKSTVVYVTHDQVEAMTLADRIVILNKGNLEQVGTPLEVYHRPRTRFVASFIGTPSMNFVNRGQVPAAPAPAGAHTLGFRPESARLQLTGSASLALGTGRVRLVETLGHVAYVHLRLAEADIIVETRADTHPRLQDEVPVWIDPTQLFYFRESGEGLEV